MECVGFRHTAAWIQRTVCLPDVATSARCEGKLLLISGGGLAMLLLRLAALWCVLVTPSAMAETQESRGASSTGNATATSPDIVVILADDFGVLDGTPWGGSGMRTPRLQQLADAGLVFDNAFVVSPSCAPSRAALLTGCWPARNGAESNHRKPHSRLRKWPAWFRELGYDTAAFGKVSHYGQTAEYGFDHFAHDTFHDHGGIQAAVDFLRQRSGSSSRPLCLMVGSNWPHVPWPDASEWTGTESLPLPAGSIDTPQTHVWRRRYAAAVARLDRDIGTIVDAVQQHLPNALIIFSADHGAQWPFGKWNLYDAGLRTPLIAVWPGKIEPGRTMAMTSWIDLLPTLVEAAGGQPIDGIDGRSFLPVLMGRTQSHRDVVFASHVNDNRMNVYPMRAVRTQRWKYIRNLLPEAAFTTHIDLVAGRLGQRAFFAEWEASAVSNPVAAATLRRYHQRPAEELYDLESDPNEQQNLAGQAASAITLQELRHRLDEWLTATEDQLRLPVAPRLLRNPKEWGAAAARDGEK